MARYTPIDDWFCDEEQEFFGVWTIRKDACPEKICYHEPPFPIALALSRKLASEFPQNLMHIDTFIL